MTRTAVIGIGNPGKDYEGTFHNVGAAFVEWLAEQRDASWKRLDRVRYAACGDLVLALTGTFMNESGQGVAELIGYLKLDPAHVVIAHDDTDLELGRVKLVRGGGSAGHKGIISIAEALGTPDFWRLRIGARPARFAGPPHIKAENFVLNRLGAEEREILYGAGFGEAARLTENEMVNEMPSGPVRSSAIGSVTPESDGSDSSARLNESS